MAIQSIEAAANDGFRNTKGDGDMRSRTLKLAVALALLAVVGAIGRSAFADEQVPCDRRLPKNVLAFVSLRNVSDFKSEWSKTLFAQLERDEALADFRADVEKQPAEASQQLEDQIGLSLGELLSIPAWRNRCGGGHRAGRKKIAASFCSSTSATAKKPCRNCSRRRPTGIRERGNQTQRRGNRRHARDRLQEGRRRW